MEYTASDGSRYYYNVATQVTSWTRPKEEELIVPDTEDAWIICLDDKNRRYFHDVVHNVTSWKPPSVLKKTTQSAQVERGHMAEKAGTTTQPRKARGVHKSRLQATQEVKRCNTNPSGTISGRAISTLGVTYKEHRQQYKASLSGRQPKDPSSSGQSTSSQGHHLYGAEALKEFRKELQRWGGVQLDLRGPKPRESSARGDKSIEREPSLSVLPQPQPQP